MRRSLWLTVAFLFVTQGVNAAPLDPKVDDVCTPSPVAPGSRSKLDTRKLVGYLFKTQAIYDLDLDPTARACVLCPKTDHRDENCHAGNPTTTALRHYILCLEAVRRHRSRQALDIIEGNWRTSNRSFDSWSRRRASAETRRGTGNRNVVPGPGPPARNIRA